jgi:hypothetical protein
MSELSTGAQPRNRFKPFLQALQDAGATTILIPDKDIIVAGYRGNDVLIQINDKHLDWFGVIHKVTTPEQAVEIITGT